jgi:serine protease
MSHFSSTSPGTSKTFTRRRSRRSFRPGNDIPGAAAFHAQFMGTDGWFTFVAESGDALIGYITLEHQSQSAGTFRVARNRLYVHQLSVHPAHRRTGVGAALMRRAEECASTVAVIDTGIPPHPDLEGRVLPGYDFISDPERARDGNARDPDPRDEGDWSDGECGGAYDSFFHGLFVAGQIAANTNNGIGIAGLAGGVDILPIRTLGKCGGTFEDVLEGMLWASGVKIAGVPANTTPAKVINMSLGGFGTCDQAIQEAVDDALTHGAVVVVSAGNESTDVSDVSPANCGGVIAVGAHNVEGSLTSYSNFGRGVTLSAPGGDLPVDGLIISLANEGRTVPTEPGYIYGAGTSFSAPLVSGTAALMLARNPLLTSGRVQDLLTGTTRNFPVGSACTAPNLCGAGMLDAGAVIASTIPGGPPPPNAFRVVEYYRADLDHYFITASPVEQNFVDTFLRGIFKRTGLYFYAYLGPFLAPPGVRPVCRFYADANVQINSHYYTANQEECLFVQARWPGIWNLEQTDAFYIQVPDFAGNCAAGTLPVYRFFNNRRDANHRYTVDLSVRRAMINRAWAPEGHGPNSVVFCSPI